MKCVSHPFAVFWVGSALSKPYPKSIPNKPKAGIKTRTPTPADLFELKGSNSSKLSYPFPASKKERAKMEALGFNAVSYTHLRAHET